MYNEFDNKIVVVAGGSGGIGRGIAAAFASYGAQIVLVSKTKAALLSAADAVGKVATRQPDIFEADLRTLEGCTSVQEYIAEHYGTCDILVNAAGATRAGNFLEQTDEEWLDGFALKFFGTVRLSRAFWPMLKSANGHIVNIIGGAARTPDAEFLVGGSVNAAMHNFAKGLSTLGKIDKVNVNSILPGLTETDRVTRLFEQRAKATGTTPQEIREKLIAQDGLTRLGTPEDIAELALFLCSEGARHIQGTAIAVDGGSTPGLY
jgi:NAD(P)-dependent dehydrogenase (short-subunit alcohol dehydrogenase family)